MLQGLNDKQTEAVLTTQGPLLILAGAGSGKTRVITNRIAHLIKDEGVKPSEVLAITFTNKAAEEMRERVEKSVGMDSAGAWICTFHSSCVKILRLYSHLIGFDNNFTIYDADDQKTVIKNICKKFNIDSKRFKEKWFLGQISSAKDELISVDEFEDDCDGTPNQLMVAKVYREYQEELKRSNAFDFDDLIVKVVELLKKHPDVLERFQDRFKYISVDEYQDTNTAQFVYVSLLARKYKNICAVGDDDQSIYKFRGANIENILNFEKVFPTAKIIRMEQNYRSTKNILNAANEVIKNNTQRKDKKLWTDHEEGNLIKLYYVENPYVEALRVVDQVRKYVREGYHLHDCACLYRTNAQSRALEEAFLNSNIPYKIVGGVNFYQRKEIKDILAYLKTINNARDDLSVKRIINVPKRGIGAAAVNLIQNLADERNIGFYSALDTGVTEGAFGKSGEKLREFRFLMDMLVTDAANLPLKGLVESVLERTGYLKELEDENTDESLNRIENINELINKAVLYEEGADNPSLGGFLEEVSLVADIDSWDANEDYVSLLTIHSAKGLEFPNVFLCGMEDGLFPMSVSITSMDPNDLEEERRLAYVAITRAKKNLVMSAARMRMVRGETMVSKISRFVKEIPPNLIENDPDNIYVKDRPTEYNGGLGATSSSLESFKRKPIIESRTASNSSDKKALDFVVNDRVCHGKFGEGTVTNIIDGGRDWEVTVDFDEFGTKKMFASFAKLEKI